jgi:recombination protein RecT
MMNQRNQTQEMVQYVQQTMKAYSGELKATLPTHLQEKGAGWMSGALAAIRRNPDLVQAACEAPETLINALSEAAQKGLQPGTTEYYLTPRKNKGRNEILGIVGYQGEIELMYRAGAVSSVIVETVHANDRFEYVPGRHEKPVHEIDWFEDRGDLKLAYAYAIMKDGAVSRVVVVNRTRIERAKSASQGATSKYSPWVNDAVAMWMKTAAHDLAKWVPTSAEYVREQLRAVRDVQSETAPAAQPAPAAATGPQPAPESAPEPETVTGEVVYEQDGQHYDAEGTLIGQEATNG